MLFGRFCRFNDYVKVNGAVMAVRGCSADLLPDPVDPPLPQLMHGVTAHLPPRRPSADARFPGETVHNSFVTSLPKDSQRKVLL